MALRCNNCGAPLIAPDDGQPYIACSYCQTVTELPRRKPQPVTQSAPFRPTPAQRVEVEAVKSRKSLGSGGLRFLIAVAVVATVAGAIPGLKFLQEQRPLPTGVPANVERSASTSVAGVAVISSGSTSFTVESKSERSRVEASDARGSKKSSLRGTGGSGGAPAPSPSAKIAPAPTETAPPPPPVPKNLRVSISGAVIEAGDKTYSIKDVTSGIQKGKPGVTACYATVLAEKPDTAGTLNMGLQIAPQGTTRGVGVRG